MLKITKYMKIITLTSLLIVFSIFTTNAQTNPKKKQVPKKNTVKTISKKATTASPEVEAVPQEIIEEPNETNPLKVKYRRSSLYTIMLETPNLPYADSIKKYFVTSKIPDKFNNHNLENRIIDKMITGTNNNNSEDGNGNNLNSNIAFIDLNDSNLQGLIANIQTPYYKEYLAERERLELEAKEIGVTKKKKITEYIDKRITFDTARQQREIEESLPEEIKNQIKINKKINSDIARDIVAKWFNRSPKGGFSMNLIKSRGNYDASVLDISIAKASKRGLAALEDAGEELIKNTFVLINEFKYTNKEEVAKKTSGLLNTFASVAGQIPGGSTLANVTTLTSAGVTVFGKGYVVKAKGHLFRLNWNNEVAARFYNDFWVTDKTVTPQKKKAFDETDIFTLEYIGTDESWADIQSSIFTNKTDVKLVERATVKAIDAVIVKLQKDHDEFKTKTPLFTSDPLTAKIGLKEGLTNKSVFDVIEQQVDTEGITKYVSVGQVKVDDSYPIWDNRYGANEENPNITTDRTYFKKISGKDLYPGMLLIQKKGK